ncbi:MAG: dual specificity protein phosphatase family protein [Chloroflexi bacterium]|nr:dual specificity protein phosphatase family protein [Chloroflexota bacterium]
MYEIRSGLYVGKYRETLAKDVLKARAIGSVLQLAEPVPYSDIETLYLPVEDGEPLPPDLLAQGVAFIREQRAEGRNVLIACGAGISRAVAFAMAVLHEDEDLSLFEALQQIRAISADAMPHPSLWTSLNQYYGEDMPFVDMWLQIKQTPTR